MENKTFKQLNSMEKADYVLRKFANDMTYIPNIHINEVVRTVLSSIPNHNPINDEINLIIREIVLKLHEDGYIRNIGTDEMQKHTYCITFKGHLFLELEDGYWGSYNRRKEALVKEEGIRTLQTNLQKTMNNLTLVVAGGTAIAAVYYILEIFRICDHSILRKATGYSIILILLLILIQQRLKLQVYVRSWWIDTKQLFHKK